MTYRFEIEENEYWWGGSVEDGQYMPFSRKTQGFFRDYRRLAPNQTMPLYVSSRGRYIWSEEPFSVSVQDGCFFFEGRGITVSRGGQTLRDAYLAASREHFPFSGQVPPSVFFETAQYNTWMEFTYNPTQEGVLAYAHAIVENGFTPGILIIDEGWHMPYGDWRFDPHKFPDPRGMTDELHALGFKVMLWVVPYVTASGLKFVNDVMVDADHERFTRQFARNEEGRVAILEWWNGYGAILDMTNPVDVRYLDEQLTALMRDCGIDGFKFDGGALDDYTNDPVINGCYRGTADRTHRAQDKNRAWNAFGARYPFHEYKDTFGGGGMPVIQRLSDREHRWDEKGIRSVLPNSIVQGLIGHPFICPDMIGGGEWKNLLAPGFRVDEELFIRMAQLSAFFPMMQFSMAPWRILSEKGLDTVRRCAELHREMAPELTEIIRRAARDGEPVIRSTEYMYPHKGYACVTDQFLCGEDILVCPVLTKGTREKEILIPGDTWQDAEGRLYTEGRYTVKTPLESLLWFRRVRT